MSLFGFFHKDEKQELIDAVHKRKKKLLGSVRKLFATEKKIRSLSHLENHLLESAEKLDSTEKAAVDKVLDENRTEEQIVNYLARIEKEVLSLIESGDVEAIRTRLKKYIYIINQLAQRLENLEMTKKAQMTRITEEEEKLEREAERQAFGKTVKHRDEKKNALELMRASLQVEKKENKVARKQFYRSVTKLGTNSASLLSALFKATAETAKIATNVGRMGTAGSAALAKKVEEALKK